MNYLEYRIEYGDREIFFEPVDICITVRDKKTKKNVSLTQREELNVLLHLYILEAYEREGNDSKPEEIFIVDEEEDQNETVEDLIHAIERTTIRPPIGATVFPEGWQNYPDDEKMQLYLDFIGGKLDYLHVEI